MSERPPVRFLLVCLARHSEAIAAFLVAYRPGVTLPARLYHRSGFANAEARRFGNSILGP